MIKDEYKNQVKLLLLVMPEITKEGCFALQGGTTINLFIRYMPRLSDDIDLTYPVLENLRAIQFDFLFCSEFRPSTHPGLPTIFRGLYK
jgi:hypothetical protein